MTSTVAVSECLLTITPSHWILKRIRKYNLTHDEKLPELSFHGLRHTAATIMLAGGADIRTVAAQLRHAQVSTTANIYAGVIPAVQREAVISTPRPCAP
ncbi:MAG: tyrosine-type recombinase/integrase [Clostridiales bacterium]|nr:tyrosine-type recombinase/integrase [Clostridiales bacterium]